MNKNFKYIAILVASIAATACGGGGNSIINELTSSLFDYTYLIIISSVVTSEN